MNLSSKVAIVTGGTRGIGLAIAESLVDSGAAVVITGTDGRRLAEARDRLSASTAARVLGVKADVRDPAQVQQMIAETRDQFGGLDILVNNAGVGLFVAVEETAVEDWERVIGTNLTGIFHCCLAAIPELKRRSGGWIINISSLAGKNPFSGGAAYCASKAGVIAFSESLMQEVRHDDIRVSCILPGSVRTDFGGSRSLEDADWKLSPKDIAQVVLDLLGHQSRSLPSRVEIRPSRPQKADSARRPK